MRKPIKIRQLLLCRTVLLPSFIKLIKAYIQAWLVLVTEVSTIKKQFRDTKRSYPVIIAVSMLELAKETLVDDTKDHNKRNLSKTMFCNS